MKKKCIWLGAALALALIAVGGVPAWAGGLTVFGGKIETAAETGREYSYAMQVQNASTAPMDIAVEIKGYGTEAENQFVMLDPADDSSHHSARQYLAVVPSGFHLTAGESREIIVSANIPPGTESGGKYAIVYIHTVPKTGSVATTAGMAARVLLTVEGSKLSHISQIASVDLNSAKNLEAAVNLTNDGNQHYKPHIRGTLSQGGRILAVASMDDPWPLIPHYGRQFNVGFRPAEALVAGEYSVEIEVLDESEALVAQKTASVKLDSAYFPSIESPAAAPPPPVKNAIPAPVTIVLKPGSAATLASEDQTISINFRQGAVISQVPLTLAHYPALNAPFAPAEYQIADTCFKVEGLNGLLAKEATITVKYSASDLQSAEGDPSRLALGRWDEAAGEWTFLKTTVDPKNMTLKAATDRFSTWAVIVKPPGSSSLLLFSIWGIAAVLLLCGIWLTLKRKRRELRR